MTSHRLTAILVSLATIAITAGTAISPGSAVPPPSAQIKIAPDDGATIEAESNGMLNILPDSESETTIESETDLFLDKEEVERRALEEQTAETTTATTVSRLPVSFKDVQLPLPGGVDHAVAGVGTRNSGRGTIRLRGIPPGSTLLTAILVWGEIAAPPALAPYQVCFRSNCGPLAVVQGNSFGSAPQPCWNGAGQFFGYAASVTGLMAPGINGDYEVSCLRSAITNNRCPWPDAACAGPGNALPLSEGASLIVFYSNQCIPVSAQVFLSAGPRLFTFGTFNYNHFIGGTANLPNIKHSRIGADGQVGVANCGLRAIRSVTNERTWLRGLIPLTGAVQIKGDGPSLNADSDWNGYDGEPLNKLWDSHTDMMSNFLPAGTTQYRVTYNTQGDCLVWMIHILGIR